MVVGERYVDTYNTNKLDPYVVFSQGVGGNVWDRFDISAKVKNVLDERYQDILGYPRPGREFLLSVTAEF
jgi:outer membrane cobalamin receptor